MISLNNLTNIHERRFRSLALLTILVVYLLVLAGGIVRSTGSGMGCPDWPKCFGRWVPPTKVSQLPFNYQAVYGAKLKGEVEFNAVKTWIEYVNRLLGVFSGFLVFATLLASLPYLRKDKPVFWGSLVAFLLIGTNGWLGSRVVASELAQYMITFHLLLAILVVLSLLFVLARSSMYRIKSVQAGFQQTTLRRILLITIILSVGQIILGTQVRDALDEVIHRLGYSQRADWIANIDWRFYVHRSSSLIVLVFHVAVIYQLRKISSSTLFKRLIVGLVVLVVAEIAAGAGMAYFAVPAFIQPIHLVLAVLIIGVQFVAWLSLQPNLIVPERVYKPANALDV